MRKLIGIVAGTALLAIAAFGATGASAAGTRPHPCGQYCQHTNY